LAELFPQAQVLGVDIIGEHLELARWRYAGLAARLRLERQSIFELGFRDHSFDLTVCRHVMHSIPHPDRVLAELARVTRRGGFLHLIPEDYGMLHFQRGALDPRDFWYVVPPSFESKTGTDLFIGRNTFSILVAMKLDAITVKYVIVDTVRVPRETFATIVTAWSRRVCRADRRADADFARVRGGILRSNDGQYSRPTGIRSLDGSGAERAHTVGGSRWAYLLPPTSFQGSLSLLPRTML
jgi:ubiquinone/menaquinone biosynthesis C-methylase UbiE